MYTTKLRLLSSEDRSITIPLGRLKGLKVGTYFRVTHGGNLMDLELQAFLVGAKRKTSQIAFYNQPRAARGAVRLAPALSVQDMFALWANPNPARMKMYDESVDIRLEDLPDWVDKVVITSSIHHQGELPAPGHHFGNVALVEMHVETPDGETTHARVSFTRSSVKGRTAAVLAEIIRSDEGWLLKLIGATCHGGLRGLCRKYRVPVK